MTDEQIEIIAKMLEPQDELQLMDFEDALDAARSTIEFLHGCLTHPNYKYVYPDQTERVIQKLDQLMKRPPLCVHSSRGKNRNTCPSCDWHLSRIERREILTKSLENN